MPIHLAGILMTLVDILLLPIRLVGEVFKILI